MIKPPTTVSFLSLLKNFKDMIKMKAIINIHKKNIPLLIIMLILLILLHSKMGFFNDDIANMNKVKDNGIITILKTLYNVWSSRTIIDFMVLIMTSVNFYIFKILNCAICISIPFIIAYLTCPNNPNYLVASGLFFMYPFNHLSSAGWVSTSVVYLWPVFFLLLAMIPLRKKLDNQPISLFTYIIGTISLIVASNMEQTSLIILGILVAFNIYMYICHTRSYYSNFALVINMISIVYILSSPGNNARLNSEIVNWMVDFKMWSFADKLYMGSMTTLNHFIFSENLVFLLFSVLIFSLVCNKKSDISFRLLSLVPLASTFLERYFNSILPVKLVYFINGRVAYGAVSNEYLINLQNASLMATYIPMILAGFVLISIIISIFIIFGNSYYTITVYLILTLGFASRVIMGFSPTLFASSLRTYIFMYFAILSVMLMMFNELKKTNNATYLLTTKLLFIFSLYIYLGNF